MRKTWGLKFKKVWIFFSKHLKQNIMVLNVEIKFFCHCFLAFGG
jgi:hypothetical protein